MHRIQNAFGADEKPSRTLPPLSGPSTLGLGLRARRSLEVRRSAVAKQVSSIGLCAACGLQYRPPPVQRLLTGGMCGHLTATSHIP